MLRILILTSTALVMSRWTWNTGLKCFFFSFFKQNLHFRAPAYFWNASAWYTYRTTPPRPNFCITKVRQGLPLGLFASLNKLCRRDWVGIFVRISNVLQHHRKSTEMAYISYTGDNCRWWDMWKKFRWNICISRHGVWHHCSCFRGKVS